MAKIMIRHLAIYVALSTAIMAEEGVEMRARCELAPHFGLRTQTYYADALRDSRSRAERLRIYPENQSSGAAFEVKVKLGQEFVSNVCSVYIHNVGQVFLVEWTWGARTVGVSLYNLGEDGKIREILKDGGIGGFHIVPMFGADDTSVVIFDRDERTDEQVLRIYRPLDSGQFAPPATLRRRTPFTFEIRP